jgi:uncharacterized DUF497 family protein
LELAMQIEFDPAKDATNRAKHGIPLATGEQVIEGAVETFADTRVDYGEHRFVGICSSPVEARGFWRAEDRLT